MGLSLPNDSCLDYLTTPDISWLHALMTLGMLEDHPVSLPRGWGLGVPLPRRASRLGTLCQLTATCTCLKARAGIINHRAPSTPAPTSVHSSRLYLPALNITQPSEMWTLPCPVGILPQQLPRASPGTPPTRGSGPPL